MGAAWAVVAAVAVGGCGSTAHAPPTVASKPPTPTSLQAICAQTLRSVAAIPTPRRRRTDGQARMDALGAAFDRQSMELGRLGPQRDVRRLARLSERYSQQVYAMGRAYGQPSSGPDDVPFSNVNREALTQLAAVRRAADRVGAPSCAGPRRMDRLTKLYLGY